MTPSHDPSALVFTAPRRVGWAAAGSLALGGLFVVLLAFTFIVMVNAPPTSRSSALPGMLGGMSVVPIFSIWYGITLLRSPVRVVLDSSGLTVEWAITRRRFAWGQVASLARDKASGMAHASPFTPAHKRPTLDVLILRDDAGRELVRLTSALTGFPVLIEEIEVRSSLARGGSTYDPETQIVERRRKLRRTARRAAVAGGIMAALAVTAGTFLLVEARAESRLKTMGVVTAAKVERRYMFRVTPRLEYSFHDSAGLEHKRDAMLEQAAWEKLAGAGEVEVRYLPADPERSHLVAGEVIDEPPLVLLLAGAGFMALLGVVVMALPILGIADIKLKDGRVKLVRFDEVDDSLEAPPGGPPEVIGPGGIVMARLPQPGPERPVTATGRPGGAGITVLAALAIALGAWAAGLNAIRLVGAALLLTPSSGLALPPLTRGLWIAGAVLGLVMFVGGIGLAVRRRWGRVLALMAAAGQACLGVAMIINVLVVNPFPPAAPGDPAAQMQHATMTAGAVFFPVLGMVFPVVALFLLGRRSAAEQFR